MFDPRSYCFSRQLSPKISPPIFEPRKRPRSGRFWELGLGFSIRNDTENLSLNGWLSPKLGSRRIYSTSFFCPLLSSLAIYRSTEVRYSFAWRSASTTDVLGL